jgi:hypothetical protein
MELLLAFGDASDSTWTGLSGVVLGILIGLALLIWIFKGLHK